MQRDAQGNLMKLCQVKMMLNEPSATLVDETGREFTWAQSLCRDATAEQTIAYWKASAEQWKKRAAQHGCNTTEGDHECG